MPVLGHLLDEPGGRLARVAEDHGLPDGDHTIDVGYGSMYI